MALSFVLSSLALSNPGDTQTCQKISVGDNDALGCFNYAVLNRSDAFFDGDQLTVYWEASHTGANELHFGLSSATTTEVGDDDHRVEGDGGTDRGRHTLNYRVQNFYELLMYPNGAVRLRRPGPNLNRWRAYASGNFVDGFSYNTEGDSHRFWTLYNRASGLYRFGVGTTAGQNQVLTWTDPNPVDVRYVSANVYCCGAGACDARAHDEGFFCMCTGPGQDCGDGLGPPTTPFPSGSPTTSAPVTTAPTTAAPTTAQPTATPSTTPPSPEPTLGPTFHPCTDGTHTCDTDTTYCAVHSGGGEFTCECNQGLTRLTDTACIRTARPTAAPTTPNPTTLPTTLPTTSVPTSNPSSMPTISSPTGSPTKFPTYSPVETSTDATNVNGEDATIDASIAADPAVVVALAELRAAEANLTTLVQTGATEADIDTAVTAVQERRANYNAAVSAARAGAEGSKDNEASAGSSSTTTVVVIVVVMVLIVVGVIVGAVIYVKHHTAARAPGHDNPLYDQNGHSQQQNATYAVFSNPGGGASSGYMDVPAGGGSGGAVGYMDVAPNESTTGYMDVPAGYGDDDAEDV